MLLAPPSADWSSAPPCGSVPAETRSVAKPAHRITSVADNATPTQNINLLERQPASGSILLLDAVDHRADITLESGPANVG